MKHNPMAVFTGVYSQELQRIAALMGHLLFVIVPPFKNVFYLVKIRALAIRENRSGKDHFLQCYISTCGELPQHRETLKVGSLLLHLEAVQNIFSPQYQGCPQNLPLLITHQRNTSQHYLLIKGSYKNLHEKRGAAVVPGTKGTILRKLG